MKSRFGIILLPVRADEAKETVANSCSRVADKDWVRKVFVNSYQNDIV